MAALADEGLTMFTKIKTAWSTFLGRIAQRIVHMALEAEILDGAKAVEAEAAAALTDAVKGVEAAVAKVEAVIDPAKPGIPVYAVIGTAAPSSAAVPSDPILIVGSGDGSTANVEVSTDAAPLVAKVKDLLGLADRLPASFDALASLAIKSTAGDVDAVLARLKAMLDYGKARTDVWDEIVAAAKAL